MRSDKYELAKHIAPEYQHTRPAELYHHLHSQGYYWNSNVSWWVKKRQQKERGLDLGEIQIRITSDEKTIKQFSGRILELLKNDGFNIGHLNPKNPPTYPCKPLGSSHKRVYLTIRAGE